MRADFQIPCLQVQTFDKVLIDGRARSSCAVFVLKFLHPQSIVFIHGFPLPATFLFKIWLLAAFLCKQSMTAQQFLFRCPADFTWRTYYHKVVAQYYDKVAQTNDGQTLVVLRPKPVLSFAEPQEHLNGPFDWWKGKLASDNDYQGEAGIYLPAT
jgi:hypothetical protein